MLPALMISLLELFWKLKGNKLFSSTIVIFFKCLIFNYSYNCIHLIYNLKCGVRLYPCCLWKGQLDFQVISFLKVEQFKYKRTE